MFGKKTWFPVLSDRVNSLVTTVVIVAVNVLLDSKDQVCKFILFYKKNYFLKFSKFFVKMLPK
jgi:hypothetical protein